ncbi:MAG: antibiotic biosynthesis monooxygenase [Xanthobacteraceae bacterium]
MRRVFRLPFCLAFFAALLMLSAHAEDDAVYSATYMEVPPFEGQPAKSEAALELEHYRDMSRREAGNLRFDALIELGRPNRFVILQAWRNAAARDAHDKAEGTIKYHQAIATMQNVPPDIRANAALFLDPNSRKNQPGAIDVVTHIDVTNDHKDDCVALLRSMSEDTIKEPGNLRYDVFAQKNRPNHFTVIEAWTDRKALADHATAAHARMFRAQLLPMQGALYDERLYVSLP